MEVPTDDRDRAHPDQLRAEGHVRGHRQVSDRQQDAEGRRVCVTEDGLPLVGNTAATRPRLAVYGYDSTVQRRRTPSIDNAFVGRGRGGQGPGRFTFDADGVPCTRRQQDPDCLAFDEGKNIKYFTFSMSITDTVGGTRRTACWPT